MPVLRFFCNEFWAVSLYNLFRKNYQACKDFRNHRFIREIRFHGKQADKTPKAEAVFRFRAARMYAFRETIERMNPRVLMS